MPRKAIQAPQLRCTQCSSVMERKRYPGGDLECMSNFLQRKYCNQDCMSKAFEGRIKVPNAKNSRRQSGKAAKEACEACGKTSTLHVHHADESPLNNSQSNLKTLCARCHREAHSPNFSAPRVRLSCKHCEKPAMRIGLCWTHNTRAQKYGDPLLTKKKIGSKYVLVRVAGP